VLSFLFILPIFPLGAKILIVSIDQLIELRHNQWQLRNATGLEHANAHVRHLALSRNSCELDRCLPNVSLLPKHVSLC
jgi:hypothetical protein